MVDDIRVYIAGPYTGGDPAVNTAVAMKAWHELADVGFVPFCPHLSHFLHIHQARPYAEWLKHDLCWMHVCHAMLRLPGESHGADAEEAEFGGPVFHSVNDLCAWRDGRG